MVVKSVKDLGLEFDALVSEHVAYMNSLSDPVKVESRVRRAFWQGVFFMGSSTPLPSLADDPLYGRKLNSRQRSAVMSASRSLRGFDRLASRSEGFELSFHRRWLKSSYDVHKRAYISSVSS